MSEVLCRGVSGLPGGDFASSVDLIPFTLPDGTSGTNVLVKADKYGYLLAADVPESVLALMIATQRPIALAALNEKLTSAAWTSKPSWQIRLLLDPVIPQAEFKFEAERAHSHIDPPILRELPNNPRPADMLSAWNRNPRELADRLARESAYSRAHCAMHPDAPQTRAPVLW